MAKNCTRTGFQADKGSAAAETRRRASGAGLKVFFPRLPGSVDIRYRLIVYFILVSLIPLLIFGAISYSESSEAIRKKNGLFEADVVKQLVHNIQEVMEKAGADATPATDHVRTTQAIFSHIFDGVLQGDGSIDGAAEASVFVLDLNDGRIVISPPGDGAMERVETGEGSTAPAPVVMADPGLLGGLGRIIGSSVGPNFVSYTGADGRDYLATCAPVPATSWVVVSVVPMHALTGEVHTLRNKIVSIGLICAVFVLLASYAIWRSNHVQINAMVAAHTQALREANRELEALSATDGLTGLANRRRLDEVLGNELRRAVRSSAPLAVVMLDVDFFKKYNDHYGHQAGDVCLRRVADALCEGCHRAGDLVARYGGEEFVLVAPETDLAGALAMAEALRAAVEALRLPHAESEFGHVTVSIGVFALHPGAGHHADLLLSMADRAMYSAKLQGRNRVASSVMETNED